MADELTALAAACGVQTEYHDWQGQYVVASHESVMATLRALGLPIERPDQLGDAWEAARARAHEESLLPVCQVVWGEAALEIAPDAPDDVSVEVALELEDGSTREARGRRIEGPLPHGYHRLTVKVGDQTQSGWVICAPERAWSPPDESPRRWGLFAPLYAIRREGGSGAGDLGDLVRLAGFMGERGGRVTGTLPLLAGFLDEPFEPSPYGPASRLFWNELYVDLDRLGAEPTDAQRQKAGELAAGDLVDYRAQMAWVRSRLEPKARRAWSEEREALEEFARTHPRVDDYARFRAAGERQRTFYDCWPEPLRSGSLTEADYDEEVRRYHLFAQYAMEQQLAALGDQTELYLDLPVGVHLWSYDRWREPELFAEGVSSGAPPDALFSGGQCWGFPPVTPRASRATAHAYFAASVRAHMRHASLLRIDHVIGMHRLYWIPEGLPATDGCFARYPSEELYAVLCLESHRNRCAVAGEDLGTVPPEVGPTLRHHGMHRLYVGEFVLPAEAHEPIPEPPAEAVASLNTHDTPTFAGYWAGREIDDRREMGLLTEEEARAEHEARERQRRAACQRFGVDPGTEDPRWDVMDAWHGQLARSQARVVLITLEDLWLDERPQNVPGTGRERPNWRRKMARTLEEITSDEHLGRRLEAIDASRRD